MIDRQNYSLKINVDFGALAVRLVWNHAAHFNYHLGVGSIPSYRSRKSTHMRGERSHCYIGLFAWICCTDDAYPCTFPLKLKKGELIVIKKVNILLLQFSRLSSQNFVAKYLWVRQNDLANLCWWFNFYFSWNELRRVKI